MAAVRSFAFQANKSSLAMTYQKSIERLVLTDNRTLARCLVYIRNLGVEINSLNSSVLSCEALGRISEAIVDLDRLTAESRVQLSKERSTKLYALPRIQRERERHMCFFQ